MFKKVLILTAAVFTAASEYVSAESYPVAELVKNPDINGVIIICEGGDDLTVKMNIIEIITTALNVSADKIRILKMK